MAYYDIIFCIKVVYFVIQKLEICNRFRGWSLENIKGISVMKKQHI